MPFVEVLRYHPRAVVLALVATMGFCCQGRRPKRRYPVMPWQSPGG
ncbi:hypothetical protein H9638_06455 [Arthrobacter sp. Sa2BUA2]|uniref:Uncharacterized protein n=1 Tax=Arthrobacter pullicola TaxID=2762224 RepID=A0ABR8YH32_9MICC|nr:hypothetical protein [Arthrobacter pullicola]MBD8043451.1 hypothetical protein [Arthrobacter pullicola]